MKQYFKYFGVFYILFAILLVMTAAVWFFRRATEGDELQARKNLLSPAERVYDYADVLTAKEEEKLRGQIEKAQQRIGCDLVLVTLKESVLQQYGYTVNTDAAWKQAIQQYADVFYETKQYGFNKVYGNGAILVDNWYEGEAGCHFGTYGAVYETYSNRMIEELIDDVYFWIDTSPYEAYKAYIEHVVKKMDHRREPVMSVMTCFLIGLVPAIIYIMIHLKNAEGKKTTNAFTYIDQASGGQVEFAVQTDELINKYVTSHRIERNSTAAGAGRGGSHRSSSGRISGGGSRRR